MTGLPHPRFCKQRGADGLPSDFMGMNNDPIFNFNSGVRFYKGNYKPDKLLFWLITCSGRIYTKIFQGVVHLLNRIFTG